ncbi:hypothetical protein JVT61DRAFT_15298 [Boletus reticuloceps]|uniref:Protein kinase domain-containing protein n=1 Tax=Boletus reticuloceps TaxID=495285 RepID=A0A8I2YSU5_9AGAM|nr:hypothetical protein JVT61DRAFT_15298 [Boletus reticuloceps]
MSDPLIHVVRTAFKLATTITSKSLTPSQAAKSRGRTIAEVVSDHLNADKTSPDLVATGKCRELQTYLVVTEDKNEFGDGGSDPSVQAAFSFQRIICQEENEEIRLRCCCPAFMIAHAGPWLAIMGGIIPGDCIVQRLTDFFWIPVHSTHDDNQFLRIARIFYALRESIECLDSWYKDTVNKVPPFKLSFRVPHPRFFPSPNAYRDGDNLVRFEYQEPLELDVSCVTYRAKTLGDNPKDIVVKFVTSYGADAHREMALAGLAPELLYYGEINVEPGMSSYGDLRMVVMEYVDGLTLNKAWEQRKVPQSFQSDLCKAFQHLHDAGYVYGDLRQPNVMIMREGKVQLIDFDWAGKEPEGEVKCPVAISIAISSYLNWLAHSQGT